MARGLVRAGYPNRTTPLDPHLRDREKLAIRMGEADLGGDPFDRDRSVWGDDPEEMDASAVVEELPTAYPKAERRWHERPAFVPFKAIGMFIEKSGKRIAVTAVGFLLLLVAVIIIPIPGPWSILLSIVALSILATEYVWAERLLRTAREKAEQAKNMVLRRNDDSEDDAAES